MVRPRCAPVFGLLAALALALPARAEDAQTLQGAAAWQKLVGNTVVAKTPAGAAYTDYYQADGTVRHRDNDGATAGTWRLDGDHVCFDYPDDDDRFCAGLSVTGTSGAFTESEGAAPDTFELLPGNAKGL